MSSNLPLPVYLALNQEQKEEIPEYSQKVYEINDNNPVVAEKKNNIFVVNDGGAISNYPTAVLPANPEVGDIVSIAQGRKNALIVSGNGKDILIDYVKYSTGAVSSYMSPLLLSDSGNSYDPDAQCSFTVSYNGSEWQSLRACLLVNLSDISLYNTFTAARYYGMVQEAGYTPVLLTFTYKDNNSDVYPGKTIGFTANKSAFITPNSMITNGSGIANSNVSCGILGSTIYTANFINFDGQISTLSLTIDYYEDSSTVMSDKDVVYVGTSYEATISVKIRDTASHVYSDKDIQCISNQNTDLITTISNPTDITGVSTFTISATEAHTSIISAKNLTDNYSIANTASILFVLVPPPPEPPLDSIQLRYESFNGVVSGPGNTLVLWFDTIQYYSMSFVNNPGLLPMLTNGVTPSGEPAMVIQQGYNTYYQNDYTLGALNTARTMCIVGKFPNTGYYKFFLGDPDVEGGHFECGNYGDKFATCSVYNPQEMVAISNDYVWHVYMFTNDNTVNTNFYLDNVFIGSRTTGVPNLTTTKNGFYSNYYGLQDAYIAALFTYTKVLSTEERNQLYDYLTDKYGV